MAVMTYKEGSKGAVVKQIQKVVGCYPDGIWGRLTTERLAAMGIAAVTPQTGASSAALSQVTACYGSKVLTLRKSKRRIDEIIVHCTASREGQEQTVEQIRRDHTTPVSKGGRGWSDIGYHYVVYLDGTVHEGRNVDISGAHAEGHNSHSIGVVYVGGVENRPGVPYAQLKAKDTRTEQQKASLMALLMDLRKLYPTARIIGHRDVDTHGKACPSFDAKTEYKIL